MAGQTINDRLLAAKHSLAGQGLAKSVCKATTEELMGPKKKHLDYLIHCTNEPNVSIPQLANLLVERSQNASWIVVFKSLITTHHLMCYGNERFTQYLASSNSTFQLSNFLDKSAVQGYDMSPFIRRYARYLNEKALSYRTVAFDFCKAKRGKDGALRTMNSDKLLKTLPVLQSQLDALLEFDCAKSDFTNPIISVAFLLLFRDLIRLFAGYNDSIINLLEKYFDMNKKQCKDALDLYKKFLIRMDRVGEFLKVAEAVGVDKGEIPDLTKAPSSLLDALEQHLATLEGRKMASSVSSPVARSTDVKSGVSALATTSSSFGTAEAQAVTVDEQLALQALAEEEALLNQYKAKVQSPQASNVGAANANATNPFFSSPSVSQGAQQQQPILDLFSSNSAPAGGKMGNNAIDDLLQLNPFANALPTASQPSYQPTNLWPTQGTTVSTNGFGNTNSFVSEQGFSSAFSNVAETYNNSQNAFTSGTPTTGKVLTGDLESSLASLAENLTITKVGQPPKGIQWNNNSSGSKGNSPPVWNPQPMAVTTGANYKPMGQGMASNSQLMFSQHFGMGTPNATNVSNSSANNAGITDPFGVM